MIKGIKALIDRIFGKEKPKNGFLTFKRAHIPEAFKSRFNIAAARRKIEQGRRAAICDVNPLREMATTLQGETPHQVTWVSRRGRHKFGGTDAEKEVYWAVQSEISRIEKLKYSFPDREFDLKREADKLEKAAKKLMSNVEVMDQPLNKADQDVRWHRTLR